MYQRWLVQQLLRQASQSPAGDAMRTAAQQSARQAWQHFHPDRDNLQRSCETLFAFGLGMEADACTRELKQLQTVKCEGFLEYYGNLRDAQVVMLETGEGRQRAYQALINALQLHRPPFVLAGGFATSITEEVAVGDVILASSVTQHGEAQATGGKTLKTAWRIDPDSLQRRWHWKPLISLDEPPRDASSKRELASQHTAAGFDLESYGMLEACHQLQIPCYVIRLVTEGVDDQLPADIDCFLKQDNWASKLGAAAGSLWRRPGSAKDLWRLKEEAFQASERLAKIMLMLWQQMRH